MTGDPLLNAKVIWRQGSEPLLDQLELLQLTFAQRGVIGDLRQRQGIHGLQTGGHQFLGRDLAHAGAARIRHHLGGFLDEALDAVELRGVFDGSRTADETAGKPSPLMLEQLMREFGVDPGRTLMIGDTTHDLQMAVNAGCDSVGVSYGAHEPAAFASLSPRFVAHSVGELSDWLKAHA